MENGYGEPYCKHCGLTETEFKDSYYVGCPDCYKYLRNAVLEAVAETQGATRHTGRAPKTAPDNPELERLIREYERALVFNRMDDADRILYKIHALGGSIK
ncbi:MAG: hypothetical protein LBT55_04980 [Clostridiaceae bacterium]|jgi:protein arginine kinase activator|nr:hypothetical protein [Clostridiaceae bacterium]